LEEHERKNDSKKAINKISDSVDDEIEKNKLFEQLQAIDSNLALSLDED